MRILLLSLMMILALSLSAAEVNISAELESVTVEHGGQPVTIMRNQSPENTINPAYARTSRPCPPFCINPITLAPGVETIGELELLDYLQRQQAGDDTLLIIDSRTPDWVKRGTIPGSINVPWTQLSEQQGADPISIEELLTQTFGAQVNDGLWDFSTARTLVLFCNGAWCGQSPNNIRSLLKYGYPADKLKWYRGGMQSWESLGLTTVQ